MSDTTRLSLLVLAIIVAILLVYVFGQAYGIDARSFLHALRRAL
jgi:hypothetical protein